MHKEKTGRTGNKKKKKVILDKGKFTQFVIERESVKDYKIPLEWNVTLKLDVAKQHILKVKGATLNDHLQCQKLSEMPGMLFSYITQCSEKGEKITPEAINKLLTENRMANSTVFEIGLFSKNVIEPKFTVEETITLSEKIPEFVNSVVKFSLGITAI